MNTTVTVPTRTAVEWVNALFDGTRLEPELEFPFDKNSVNIQPGEWVYLIYQGMIRGRFQVTRIEHSAGDVPVGPDQRSVTGRTVVWVHSPGESAGTRTIQRDGHRSYQYAPDVVW
jgi:hypothetical protein